VLAKAKPVTSCDDDVVDRYRSKADFISVLKDPEPALIWRLSTTPQLSRRVKS
jgi:hypothetical protein